MDIKVPLSWLKEYLKTDASAKEIAQALSACSQSVERITSRGQEKILEIEITTNRPDCLSVYGLCRELGAILPRFNHQAIFKNLDQKTVNLPKIKKGFPLIIDIKDSSLCPRFTAVIFDNVKVGPSPKIVQDRLTHSGIRALNNVIDVSNYLMLELGQPMHTFDYDKIQKATMVLKESKKGESLTTLDGQKRVLPPGAIVIEDGDGRIIDLCGIMGGENSAVDSKTQRVLLFVQTYDPAKIRSTCQNLAFRTEAASRFEKGVDPEGVPLAIAKAISLFRQNCQAKVASEVFDIYPHPLKTNKVSLTKSQLDSIMGLDFPLPEAQKILTCLGLKTKRLRADKIEAVIPHWRAGDLKIPEDLVEEVARIYGYNRLPSVMFLKDFPKYQADKVFYWQTKVKTALKYAGFVETASYSMTGVETLKAFGINPKNLLAISNPLFKELTFLRISLVPAILEVLKNNQRQFPQALIFELANIYLSQGPTKLPTELPRLCGAGLGQDFFTLKALLTNLLADINLSEFNFTHFQPQNNYLDVIFVQGKTAEIRCQKKLIGFLGEVSSKLLDQLEIKSRVTLFDLDFLALSQLASTLKKYHPIPKYPPIIEDLSFTFSNPPATGQVISSIKNLSADIAEVVLWDSFEENRTFRISYQSLAKTLSDKETKSLREKIITTVESQFSARLTGR